MAFFGKSLRFGQIGRMILGSVVAGLGLFSAAPLAQAAEASSVDFYGQLELRAVQSDLDFDEGEDIDTSGFGARAEAGADWQAGETSAVRIEIDASVFEYNDEDRDARTSYGGRIELTQAVSDEIELRLHARRVKNIAVLEANSADQTSAGARLQWQKGNDRVRIEAEYRAREYDASVPGESEGYRIAAQYNRRLGSYHWVRIDLRHEEMDSSDAPQRSYDRRSARLKYSLPIGKRLRLRPSIEYREWKYDARIAEGDPNGDLRRDSYVAPGVDLAWGRDSGGPYALASAEYRIRSSNDERYDHDAIRVGLRVGYRF